MTNEFSNASSEVIGMFNFLHEATNGFRKPLTRYQRKRAREVFAYYEAAAAPLRAGSTRLIAEAAEASLRG